MKISDAATLIRNPLIDPSRPQIWADLGCGSGTFTLALAQLLAPGSVIYAVDFDPATLARVPSHFEGVTIQTTLGDLRDPQFLLPSAEGFLLANVLHFIPDQQLLLNRLMPAARTLLFVEYERTEANPWGPYPAPFNHLRELLIEAGAQHVERLATRRSRFGGILYSACTTSSGGRINSA